MIKLRCRLCGGKLSGNRCTFCGLDNSVYDRDHSYLKKFSEQQTIEQKAEQNRQAIKRAAPQSFPEPTVAQSATVHKQAAVQRARTGNTAAASRTNAKPERKRIPGILIIIIIAVFTVIPVLGGIGTALSDAFSTLTYSESNSDDWDPYAYVTREIPETGEAYETVISAGIYQVGVHIPEGIYNADLMAGNGSLNVSDYENSIYDYTYFDTDEEYGGVVSQGDIRLYNGASVKVDSNVLIHLTTSNAQPLTQEPYSSTLSDVISLTEGEYLAGNTEVPEGIYDISVNDPDRDHSGYASITLTYPNGESDYFWVDSASDAVSADGYSSEGIKNIIIPDSTQISIEYGTIVLHPGNACFDVDYDTYPQQ